jgi:hypothetical protein
MAESQAIETLADALMAEITRVRNTILPAYLAVGPNGAVASGGTPCCPSAFASARSGTLAATPCSTPRRNSFTFLAFGWPAGS